MTPEIATQLISNLGVLVVLAWYMYYNVTVTIPNVVKLHTDAEERTANRFTDAAEKKDKLFAETQRAISDNFSTVMREERVYRREEIDALKNWIKAEASCRHVDYNTDHK